MISVFFLAYHLWYLKSENVFHFFPNSFLLDLKNFSHFKVLAHKRQDLWGNNKSLILLPQEDASCHAPHARGCDNATHIHGKFFLPEAPCRIPPEIS